MKLLVVLIAIFAICNADMFRDKFSSLDLLKQGVEISHENAANYHQLAGEVHREIFSSIKAEVSKRTARSAQCTIEVTKMATLIADPSCLSSLTSYFTSTDATTRSNAVTNFCNSCSVNFTVSLNAVAQNCNRTEFDYTVVRKFQFYPSFICLKQNNEFCANSLVSVSTQSSTITVQITTAQLDQICTPCVYAAMTLLQKYVVVVPTFYRNIAFLRGLCIKNNGKYCFTTLANAFQVYNQSNSLGADTIGKLLDVTCSACFRLVTARYALSTGLPGLALLSAFGEFGKFCRKSGKEFCLVKLYKIAQQYITSQGTGFPCSFSGNSSSSCSDNCKNLITDMINQGGCCWTIVTDFVADSDPTTRQEIINAFTACSGKNISACPSLSKAKITVTYTNIYTTAITMNQQAFLSKVALDLSITYGGVMNVDVSTAKITVTGNDVTVEIYVIVPGTSSDVFSTDTVATDNVNQNYDSADVTQPVSANARSSDITTTSSSSQISFGFNLLFILCFFILISLF